MKPVDDTPTRTNIEKSLKKSQFETNHPRYKKRSYYFGRSSCSSSEVGACSGKDIPFTGVSWYREDAGGFWEG